MSEKQTIDPVHGAIGKEMTEEDLSELNEDIREYVEEEPEPQPGEPSVEPEEDLPEGPTEPQEEVKSQLEEESEIDRLKRIGLYREGLIEDFDDLGKSYKHLEKAFSERPHVEKPTQPLPDPEEIRQNLAMQFENDPVKTMMDIGNAYHLSTQQEINKLRNDLFYSSRPEAQKYKDEIDGVLNNTGIGINDAWDMIKGRHFDEMAENSRKKAVEKERHNASERRLALREKPGGIRTTPPDPAKAVAMAALGTQGDAQQKVDAMIKVLEQQGLGAKDT